MLTTHEAIHWIQWRAPVSKCRFTDTSPTINTSTNTGMNSDFMLARYSRNPSVRTPMTPEGSVGRSYVTVRGLP